MAKCEKPYEEPELDGKGLVAELIADCGRSA